MIRERLAKRLGLMPKNPPITIRNDAPEAFRVGLYAAMEPPFDHDDLRELVCCALGIMPDASNWSKRNILNEVRSILEECEWFKVYEVAEAAYEKLVGYYNGYDRYAKEFEQRINLLLVDIGIGFEMKGGIICERKAKNEGFQDTTAPAQTPPMPESTNAEKSFERTNAIPWPWELEAAQKNATSSSTLPAVSSASKPTTSMTQSSPPSVIGPTAHAEAKTGDIHIHVSIAPGTQASIAPCAAHVAMDTSSPDADQKASSSDKVLAFDKCLLQIDAETQTVELCQTSGGKLVNPLGIVASRKQRKLVEFITGALDNGSGSTTGDKDTAKRIREAIREVLRANGFSDSGDPIASNGGDSYQILIPVAIKSDNYAPENHQSLDALPPMDTEGHLRAQ